MLHWGISHIYYSDPGGFNTRNGTIDEKNISWSNNASLRFCDAIQTIQVLLMQNNEELAILGHFLSALHSYCCVDYCLHIVLRVSAFIARLFIFFPAWVTPFGSCGIKSRLSYKRVLRFKALKEEQSVDFPHSLAFVQKIYVLYTSLSMVLYKLKTDGHLQTPTCSVPAAWKNVCFPRILMSTGTFFIHVPALNIYCYHDYITAQ